MKIPLNFFDQTPPLLRNYNTFVNIYKFSEIFEILKLRYFVSFAINSNFFLILEICEGLPTFFLRIAGFQLVII